MPANDDYYKKIGFMCGLEIHQRIDTDEKLFCSCRDQARQRRRQASTITRRQRAVAGEQSAA